jgi:NAD(P)-dependent dehydrogenase (short-subunit alcohol dehydrogenase family)
VFTSSAHNPNTHGRLCLVTGANTGIGFEVARGLARDGFRVVLACRDRAKGEAARSAIASETRNPDVELLVVDLASQKSIRSAAQEFSRKHDALDVLINNAGTTSSKRRESPEGVEITFATNVLGYHLLTFQLLELLQRAPAARVINTASMMAYGLDLDDVNFKRRRYSASAAYAQSKQADRMLTWALARRLADTSVTANALHPGAVNTALLRAMSPGSSGITPAEGADTAIWLATSPEVAGVSGRLWVRRRETPCEFRGRDNEEALWSLCERMTAG